MPTYDYQCKNCGNKQEAFQKMSDAPLTRCAKCGQVTLQRGPGGGSGFVLQGGGWYSSDYSPTRPVEPSSGGCCPCGKGQGSCSTPKSET